MDLLSAARSGRLYRRNGWSNWTGTNSVALLSVDDILADDWEVEPEKKPRRRAYIDEDGLVRFGSESGIVLYTAKNPNLVRAPWLDEPEV